MLMLSAQDDAAANLYDDFIYEARGTVAAIDERPIQFYLDHPADGEKVPLLVLIDGSGCVGQLRPRNRTDYRRGRGMPARYARLMVEKPGVEPEDDWGQPCTEEFHANYSITNRVTDHLCVLQHLRGQADWWNGDVLIWSWSDGGDIGSQIVVYDPTVTRAVLGAMGGGYTMAEHFENFWACPPQDTDDRDACIEDLAKDFKTIHDNPSRIEHWNGESRFTWDSRLKSRLSAPLADNRTPILIVHGELDQPNTPVESARKLVDDLKAAGNEAFTYWEVAGMEHGWGNLAKPDQAKLRLSMLGWLLGQDIGLDELPPLTDHSVIRALPDGGKSD
ncbi:alpha/beta hydrolase family protein [Sphingomicrobium flavum]|uniref:alpha/beta hydrolase family protein n=1 Tax=Sphingomicrobium flavum TaxID=1229164 RepID=UPI0021AD7BE5|nr:alpha/beta hydrolase [Sphingomicrobium flavum]